MAEIDLTQFMGETKPDDLCKIRDHPNRKLIKTDDCRGLCSGGTITCFYLCPDCGCEWSIVFHSTTSTTITENNIYRAW